MLARGTGLALVTGTGWVCSSDSSEVAFFGTSPAVLPGSRPVGCVCPRVPSFWEAATRRSGAAVALIRTKGEVCRTWSALAGCSTRGRGYDRGW